MDRISLGKKQKQGDISIALHENSDISKFTVEIPVVTNIKRDEIVFFIAAFIFKRKSEDAN